MARRSTARTSGCLIVLLLPIALVIGKCSDRDSVPQAAAPAIPANPAPSVHLSVPMSATYFVNSRTLNQRSAPNGAVVGRLDIGTAIEIHARSSGWARISGDGEPERWVFEKYLCEGIGCYIRTASPASVQSLASSVKRANRAYTDGSCPCSSTMNCIGPRGGRYCITSGGKKRYR